MIKYFCDTCRDEIEFSSPDDYEGGVILYPEGITTDATIGEADQYQECWDCVKHNNYKNWGELKDIKHA